MLRAFDFPCDSTESAYFIVHSWSVSRELLCLEFTVACSYSVNESDGFPHLRVAAHVALAFFEGSVLSQSSVELRGCGCFNLEPCELGVVISYADVPYHCVAGSLCTL